MDNRIRLLRRLKYSLTPLAILCILIPFVSLGAPFLVCDIPPAGGEYTGIKGTVDGTDFTTPYTLQSGAVLIYDIGTLSPGKHEFKNIRFYNSRGDGTAVPFDLPAIPAQPSGVKVVP